MRRLLTILVFLIIASSPSWSQLATVYVDATNGSDSFSGANATDSPSGTGPKATIHAGLDALANNGRLILMAGIYAGDGVDTDGSPTNTTDNADINISTARYPGLTSGLTIELRALAGNNEIRIFVDPSSVHSPNGALINHTSDQYIPDFVLNIPNGVLTFTTTTGNEYLSLAAAHSDGRSLSGLFMTAGTMDIIKGSSFRLLNGTTIRMAGTSKFLDDAPQKGNDLNVIYTGSGAYTAGPESGYSTFGSGVLTVERDVNSSIIFPFPMTFTGNDDALRLVSGSAAFNAQLTLGSIGNASQSPRTADLIINTTGVVVFNAPVNLVVSSTSASDSAISGIDVTGNATVSFQQPVTWNAAYNSSDISFPATDSTAAVWNSAGASVSFAAGAALAHSATTVNSGPVTVDVRIQNNGSGRISFGGPVSVIPRTETSSGGVQRFSVGAINSGGGTLEISGALASGLVNASSAFGGTLNILGPTTVGVLGATTGSLGNMPRTTLNLGPNTLTLLSNVNHNVSGSTVTATTGGILVKATDTVSFDGGPFVSLTIDQQLGVTQFPSEGRFSSLTVVSGTCAIQSGMNASGPVLVNGGLLDVRGPAALSSLTINSGTCSIQSSVSATGPVVANGGILTFRGSTTLASLTIAAGTCTIQSDASVAGLLSLNGGTFVLADTLGVSLTAGEYTQSGGVFNLGGDSGGEMMLRGNFTRSGGTISQGTAGRLRLIGTALQTFDHGPSQKLISLDIENSASGVRLQRNLIVTNALTIAQGGKFDLGSFSVVLTGDGAVFANNGSYNGSGYGIIMGGATTADGGDNVAGSEIQAGAGSSFSSITVDVGNANTCSLKGLSPITWSGTLGIISGTLDIASAIDLRPANPGAMVLRNVSNVSRITTSAGTFNAAGIRHSVRCIGNLLSDYTVGPDLISELSGADSLVIDVNSDFVNGDGDLTTGLLRHFQFPGAGFVYGGALIVGPLASVSLEANGKAGEALELNGTNVRHVIRGMLKSAEPGDSIVVSGASVTMAGGTNSNEASLIGSIAISSSKLCTLTGLKGIDGSFSSLQGSFVLISLGTTPAREKILGALALNGTEFTLAGNLEVTGGVAFNSGKLILGSHNLQLTTGGDFIQGPSTAGYSTTGGYIVMNRSGAQLRIANSSAQGLPNLQILANTSLAAPGWITGNLTIGSRDLKELPVLTLGSPGNDLIFTGSTISIFSSASVNKKAIISDGTTNGTPGSKLFIAGSSVLAILDGDCSIEELVFNPPSADGTFSLLSEDQVSHVLTITDILTHAGGQISLGMNHLALTGTGTQGGQRALNRSDGTIGATSGEMRFVGSGPQQFVGGPGFNVPNLRIWNAKGVTKAVGSAAMAITGTLDLSDGKFVFDGGSVLLENGATLVRRRTSAVLNNPFSYHGSISVSYLIDPDNGNLKTGMELPTEVGSLRDLRINNPSPSADSSSVILDKTISSGGTLALEAGQFDLGPYSVFIQTGGTIDVSSGKLKFSGTGALKVSSYKLTYRRSAVIGAENPEFQSGSGINVSRLSVLGSSQQPTVVSLTVNKTVGSLMMVAGGSIEFGPANSFIARNLTVRDSFTVLSGAFTNTTGTSAIISLAGSTRQAITVDSTDLTLPGGNSPVYLQLNNPSGFDQRGGDLVFAPGSMLLFTNGVLFTGVNAVVLSHTATGQGFDRQGVMGKNLSHIAGVVRQSVAGGAGNSSVYPNGRYEFPTGTFTEYRPLAITFTNSYPALTPGTIEVTYVAASPGGSAGLPIDGGGGIKVGSYANFYWQLNASVGSFGTDQSYDLDVNVSNPAFRVSKPGDLRFILRPTLSPAASAWRLLGLATGYASSGLTSSAPGDTTLTLRLLAGTRGFAGSNYLTIGLQSSAPSLVSRVPVTAVGVKLNTPVTFGVTVIDPLDQPLTYIWKVDGAVVKSGSEPSYSTVFGVFPKSVVVIFSNPAGLSDSSVWTPFGGDVSVGQDVIPTEFSLGQNYPNPFNPVTNVEFRIASRRFVLIKIFNVLGVEVATLVNEIRDPGVYVVRWNASSIPSGIYLCQLKAGEFVQTRKMVLMK